MDGGANLRVHNFMSVSFISAQQPTSWILMVARAVPKALSQRRKQTTKHANLEAAAEAFRKAKILGHFEDGKLTYERVASHYGVPVGTLHRAVNGGRTMAEYAASQQKLSPGEEEKLVNYLLESADRGFPHERNQIVNCANSILQRRLGKADEYVGKAWVDRFLQRHESKLSMHWSKPLDTLRAQALNPEAVAHWFQLVDLLVVKQGIKPENIYGMDESGFQLSFHTRRRVVGRRGAKILHKQGASDRENVTAIVTIRATGPASILPSYLRELIL